MRAAVGGALARVITEVEGLAGVVTSISGRGLEAAFGAPEAHKDNPERAVRAAFRALSAGARHSGRDELATRNRHRDRAGGPLANRSGYEVRVQARRNRC